MVGLAPLDRKLVRDLWRMRGQAFAVAIVAMCGIATLVTMRGAYTALVQEQTAYYERYRFADLFGQVKAAPLALLAALRGIPGIAEVDGRVVFDALADVPGLAEPATVRLVSIPVIQGNGLNRVHVRAGRYPVAGEVLASEAFATANTLQAGDTLYATVNGKKEPLYIAGIAISPEFVNEVRGDAFPDNKHFGVLWMPRDALAGALDLNDSFNDIAVTLAPGASEQAVIRTLDQRLAPYGGLGVYGREYQISHRFLQDEIAQDRVTGTVMPFIFLCVAAFLIHNTLFRLIVLQRAQVALLKSFGYSSIAVALHYFKFALAIVAAGGAAGIVVGSAMGHGLARMYQNFFRFPELVFQLTPEILLLAVLASVLAAATGALLGARQVLALAPAEAMHPEAPARFRPGPLERIGLQRFMPPALRMLLRNLERRAGKALISALGIALAIALLFVGQYSLDALEEIIRIHFRTAQRDDASVIFNTARSLDVVQELARLPGVLRVEAFYAAPAKLTFHHREKRVSVMGLYPQRQLRLILDERERPVELPEDGIVLSAKLAELLRVKQGERLAVAFLDGNRLEAEVMVSAIVNELIGTSAYMDARTLARLRQESETASGAFLGVDPRQQAALYTALKALPAVASVSLRETMLASFQKMVAENLQVSMSVLILFACAIAAGVVYNAARIALSEHAVELASLRILGFSRGEVGAMLLGQQAVIVMAAIPLGCILGYMLSAWLAHMLSSETLRLPVVVSARTVIASIIVVLIAAGSSAWLVWRRIRRLDLIEVLKTRE